MTARPHFTLADSFTARRLPLRSDGNELLARLRAGVRTPIQTYSASTGKPTCGPHIPFPWWCALALCACVWTAATFAFLQFFGL